MITLDYGYKKQNYISKRVPVSRGCASHSSPMVNSLSIENIIIILFSMMPLIDSLNGFLLKGGNEGLVSVGFLYRLVVLICLISVAADHISRKTLVASFLALSFMMVAVLFHDILGFSNAGVLVEIKDAAQWIYCPLLCFILFDLYQKKRLSKAFCKKTFKIMSWLTVVTIIVPYMMGLGYSTYSTSEGYIGYKAFYYATNGVTMLVIVAFASSLMEVLHTKRLNNVPLMVLSALSLVLIGTKTSYLMLLLSVGIAVLLSNRSSFSRSIIKTVIALLICGVALFLVYLIIPTFFDRLINRSFYFLTQSDNFLSFITSGRIDRIGLYLKEMGDIPMLAPFLLGIGNHAAQFNWCEMDYLDVFFEFGFIGFAFLVCFTAWVIVLGFKSGISFNSIMLLFGVVYAFVVGHVFTNAMSSMVFSLCFIAAISDERTFVKVPSND